MNDGNIIGELLFAFLDLLDFYWFLTFLYSENVFTVTAKIPSSLAQNK